MLNAKLVGHFPELSNKIKPHFIGSKWLHGIKPTHSFDVNFAHKIAHPLFVLFTPGKDLFGKSSKQVFEDSKLVAEVYKAASRKRGNVKFFGKDDQKLLTEQDYLIVHDDESREKAKLLASIGVSSQIIEKEEVSNL